MTRDVEPARPPYIAKQTLLSRIESTNANRVSIKITGNAIIIVAAHWSSFQSKVYRFCARAIGGEDETMLCHRPDQ